MSDVVATLKARKATLESDLNTLFEEAKTLTEQGKILNQRASRVREMRIQLMGALQEVDKLLGEPKAIPSEVETLPDPKPKKK